VILYTHIVKPGLKLLEQALLSSCRLPIAILGFPPVFVPAMATMHHPRNST